jgi:hypothetical protein
VLPPRPRPTDLPLPSDGRRVWTPLLSDGSPGGAAVTVSRLRDALRATAAAPSGVRPTRVLSLGCNGITTMVSNVVKTPCRDAHSKYRRPKASPLFLPRGLSSSTPTRSTLAPAEPVTSPTNRMVPEPYLVVVHRSPTAAGGLLRGECVRNVCMQGRGGCGVQSLAVHWQLGVSIGGAFEWQWARRARGCKQTRNGRGRGRDRVTNRVWWSQYGTDEVFPATHFVALHVWRAQCCPVAGAFLHLPRPDDAGNPHSRSGLRTHTHTHTHT